MGDSSCLDRKDMHRIWFILVVCFLCSCRTDSDVTVLKVSHTLPRDHPVHGALEHFAQQLHTLSAGTMRADIYPGGQLGTEREQIELLQLGSLAMTKVSSSPLEGFIPEMKVFSLPYVFRNQHHFWRALNSEPGQQLLELGTRVGLRGLAYYDAGARSFYSVDKPILAPEDLDGLKVRVMNSATAIEMVRYIGGSGTPISFGELYTALDQGVVDAAENNPPSFITSGHFEIAKYYSLSEHTYVPDIVLISEYIWQKLNAQQQAWLMAAMKESVDVQKRLWSESTTHSLALATEAGVQVLKPNKQPFSEQVVAMHQAVFNTPAYPYLSAFKQL